MQQARTILVICEYPTVSGGENSLLATVPVVSAAGFNYLIAGPADGPLAQRVAGISAVNPRVSFIPLSLVDGGGKKLPPEQAAERLARLVEIHLPDVLHANSLSMSRLTGLLSRGGLPIPTVGHIRDMLRLSKRAIGDVNGNTCLLVVSQAARAWHVAQGLQESNSDVLHNGVDGDEFAPPAERLGASAMSEQTRSQDAAMRLTGLLGLAQRSRLLAFIGQIGMRKGLDTLLDAWGRILAGQPQSDSAAGDTTSDLADWHLLLAGERWSGKEEAAQFERRLRALSQVRPLLGRVHWLGRVAASELLPAIDLLVHPARQEPLGRVLLEAGSCGRAIVATNVGGTSEIFPAGEAILVDADSPDQLQRSIRACIDDLPLRLRLGDLARKRIATAFSVGQCGRQLVGLYARLCAKVG